MRRDLRKQADYFENRWGFFFQGIFSAFSTCGNVLINGGDEVETKKPKNKPGVSEM